MSETEQSIYQHKVSDLELSVRTANVLARAEVETLEDFMALTRERVLALPNAGARTWKEIEGVQRSFTPAALREARLSMLTSALAAANRIMSEDPDIMVVVRGNELIGAVRVAA